jgi:hypothetical protein
VANVFGSNDDRAADAAAIRAHIESIFQAFIDGDEDKIFATHSEDWRGFLEGSQTPIKGIAEYMRANGFEWPRPANAPKSERYYSAGTTYKMSDFDVHFYSPELAVANNDHAQPFPYHGHLRETQRELDPGRVAHCCRS